MYSCTHYTHIHTHIHGYVFVSLKGVDGVQNNAVQNVWIVTITLKFIELNGFFFILKATLYEILAAGS